MNHFSIIVTILAGLQGLISEITDRSGMKHIAFCLFLNFCGFGQQWLSAWSALESLCLILCPVLYYSHDLLPMCSQTSFNGRSWSHFGLNLNFLSPCLLSGLFPDFGAVHSLVAS